MKKIFLILILSTLLSSSAIFAQEETQLKISYRAFLPFSTEQDSNLFERPDYGAVGGTDLSIFSFNKTQKTIVVEKLREFMKNTTGEYPSYSENWENKNPIKFSLKSSELGTGKNHDYAFGLYPDFLVIEFAPQNNDIGINNKTHRNSIFTLHRIVSDVRNTLLKDLGIESDYKKYKIIVRCDSCDTDIQDVNIDLYKGFFRMEEYSKRPSDFTNFILFGTPKFVDKEHDTTVANFNPEYLFPAIELIEIVIPYSDSRILDLSNEMDTSKEELNNLSKKLTKTSSTKDTENLIESIRVIEGSISGFNDDLKQLTILKSKEMRFLSENQDYLQIKNIDNKTYETIIRDHNAVLDTEITFLDRELDFLDSKYWSLLEAAYSKLSYQQQKEQFKKTIGGTIIFTVLGVALIDILIRSFEEEITNKVRNIPDKVKSIYTICKKIIRKKD